MNSKKIAIMQPGYLPWLGFFELMLRCDLFVFLDDVQYTVRDWRNRNKIRTKQGWQWLSVPVLHKGRRQQLIKDVQINDALPWKNKHLKAMEINYRKSRFFPDYFPGIEKIFAMDLPGLCDLNIELIVFLKECLKIDTPGIRSSSLTLKAGKNERIIDICQQLNAGELYDSQAASEFLEGALFAKKGIKIEFQKYNHPEYKQLYPPFIPYLSVIDLLFNYGPQSRKIISFGGKNQN
ncbi:MAG: WbqC family protein [Candidatus Omnitrophota bacterium]